jgi:predicted transcriptional regulator
MAIPKIKATYSLDVETVRAIEQSAQRLGVSKSELLRRAVRAVAHTGKDVPRRRELDALDALQRQAGLTEKAAGRFVAQVRRERRVLGARGVGRHR